MGHLAKPAFAIAFGENSAIDVKFYFYPLQCHRESYQLRRLVDADDLQPCLQKYAAILMFQ